MTREKDTDLYFRPGINNPLRCEREMETMRGINGGRGGRGKREEERVRSGGRDCFASSWRSFDRVFKLDIFYFFPFFLF